MKVSPKHIRRKKIMEKENVVDGYTIVASFGYDRAKLTTVKNPAGEFVVCRLDGEKSAVYEKYTDEDAAMERFMEEMKVIDEQAKTGILPPPEEVFGREVQ